MAAYRKFCGGQESSQQPSEAGFIWPVNSRQIGPSGEWGNNRGSHLHEGIDLTIAVGNPILAAKSGTITTAKDLSPNGAGNAIIIDHGDGFVTKYFHLSSIGVSEGTTVNQGQQIGLTGGEKGAPGSGSSQGRHLHFEIWKDGNDVNPLLYLPK